MRPKNWRSTLVISMTFLALIRCDYDVPITPQPTRRSEKRATDPAAGEVRSHSKGNARLCDRSENPASERRGFQDV